MRTKSDNEIARSNMGALHSVNGLVFLGKSERKPELFSHEDHKPVKFPLNQSIDSG